MADMHGGWERAAAVRSAAALEQYDRECAEMVRTWLDMDVYASVTALVDEMRPRFAFLPRLSVPWTAFLISHSELVFCLWQAGSGNSRSPQAQACFRDHYVTLRNLRQGCAHLLEEEQGHPPRALRSTP